MLASQPRPHRINVNPLRIRGLFCSDDLSAKSLEPLFATKLMEADSYHATSGNEMQSAVGSR